MIRYAVYQRDGFFRYSLRLSRYAQAVSLKRKLEKNPATPDLEVVRVRVHPGGGRSYYRWRERCWVPESSMTEMVRVKEL